MLVIYSQNWNWAGSACSSILINFRNEAVAENIDTVAIDDARRRRISNERSNFIADLANKDENFYFAIWAKSFGRIRVEADHPNKSVIKIEPLKCRLGSTLISWRYFLLPKTLSFHLFEQRRKSFDLKSTKVNFSSDWKKENRRSLLEHWNQLKLQPSNKCWQIVIHPFSMWKLAHFWKLNR